MSSFVKINTASDQLIFRSLNGKESLSSLFHYTVELVSLDGNLDLNSLLGQSISFEIEQNGAEPLLLNGIISEIGLKGLDGESSRYYIYQVEVRPQLWYLTLNQDFRIYQDVTVVEIITDVLQRTGIAVDIRLHEKYRLWQYCVQYNESDYNFIQRLMEHEGIYYYFTHQNNSHTLVLADDISCHDDNKFDTLPYRGPNAVVADEVCINQFQIYDRITPSKLSLNDYNFHKPYASLLEIQNNQASFATSRTEVYEWPGRYVDYQQAQSYTRIRRQEKEAQHEIIHASATTAAMQPGFTFTMNHAARQQDNQKYLIISTRYHIWDSTQTSSEDASKGQLCEFSMIPNNIIWRSPRTTPWPRTYGPQTARVVCPEGETIWTDVHGRVKVKFHWDRYSKDSDTSSCWIRVSSAWASQGFGAIQIPRINDEVIVDFINGDPDRPIIIGRVYNEANNVPWPLPGSATQMGFFSRSKDGHKGMANVFRFEDANGSEEIYLQAQRDYTQEIRRNTTANIAQDREETVGQDQRISIGRDHTLTIEQDEQHTVKRDQTIQIGQNQFLDIEKDQQINIKGHSLQETQNQRHEITHADHIIDIDGHYRQKIQGQVRIEAGESILLHTKQLTLNGTERVIIQGPAGKITLDAGGVTIDAPQIKLNGPVSVSTTAQGALASLKNAAINGTPLVEICSLCGN